MSLAKKLQKLSCLIMLLLVAALQALAEQPWLKVGVLLDLTGSAASLGSSIHSALILAQKDLEQRYPFALELRVEDTRSDTQAAVAAFRKLTEVEGLTLMVGPLRSSSVLALAPLAEKKQVLLFSPTASADAITNAGDYTFRNRESTALHAEQAARYFRSLGIRRVALMVAQSDNSISYEKVFSQRFPQLGGELAIKIDYRVDQKDFRAEILRARAAGPEGFYLCVALGDDGALLVRQLRESGWPGVIVGSAGMSTTEFMETVGAAGRGVVFTRPAPELATGAAAALTLSKLSDPYAANGYDALSLIAAGIAHCGSNQAECVKNFLYTVKEYPGAGGLTTIDQHGDVTKSISLYQVEAGKAERLRGF